MTPTSPKYKYRMADSIGMMEGAFFVSRTDLIRWLQTDFQLNVTKVEDCASGAIVLQVMDRLYPGKVPMQKVNWSARHEYEFMKNYKILQEVFQRCGVTKHIEVDKLIKAKYQDNLEFIQWVKCHHDRVVDVDREYDAPSRRALGICTNVPDWGKPPRGANIGNENKRVPEVRKPVASKPRAELSPAVESNADGLRRDLDQKSQEVETLRMELSKKTDELEASEAERAFYYQKLRQLEVLSEEQGRETVSVKELHAILYAEDEE
eukprot:Polyplicarium_translucidae@DN1814_c0_g2_i1.p1